MTNMPTGITMAMRTEQQAHPSFDPSTHARLIQDAKAASSTEQAWLCLEAAHVVGQSHLWTHVQTHAHMLGLAWRTHDWPEVAGQMLRLALVPLGHLSRHLPQGNPGRATVGAFKPIPVRPELKALISRVIEDTSTQMKSQGISGEASMKQAWSWLVAAWGISLISTLGAVFIGEVMGMTPCLLCWYQRIFMFPLAIILGIAAFSEDRRGAVYALPLTSGGAVLAAYHSALIAGWVPQWWVPCGIGPSCSEQSLEILNGIQIPWLSLMAFVCIAVLLFVYLRKTRS